MIERQLWPHVLLGDVAAVKTGRTPKGLDRYLADYSDSRRTIPFYKVGDMNAETRYLRAARTSLSSSDIEALGLEVLPTGTVVFPKAGGAIATNKKRVVAVPGAVDLNCMAVIPGPRLESNYLALWFEMFDLTSISDGSVLPQISRKRVVQLPIPLPTITEQLRIVEIVEDLLSRVDAGRQAVELQIGRVDILRLSRLQSARTTVILEGAPLRRVDEIAETALGKMLDSKRSAGELTPYLRNINVRWGRVDTEHIAEVPLTGEERRRFALRAGDLLVCEGGEPGRCAVWPGTESPVAYQKALHRVRTNSHTMASEFLAMMLEYVVRSGQADRFFTGTTIKHLPQEKLRNIEVPVPGLATQRALIAELGDFDTSIGRLRSQLLTASRRSESLRRSVLAAAFSGRLTGSGADIESVEEMVGV